MRMKIHRVPHRRRREGRTDYRQRLRLLKSGKPRLVIRKSSGGLVCQVVEYVPGGDRVIASAGNKQLREMGWKTAAGNVPASYLVGMICGNEAKKKKVKEAVLDIGLQSSTKGSRVYAALRGFIDAGISVPHSDEILPPDERIRGGHIEKYAARLKSENVSEYSKRFSFYTKSKVQPESVSTQFESVRKKLLK